MVTTLSLCILMLAGSAGILNAASGAKKKGIGLEAGFGMFQEAQFKEGTAISLNLFYTFTPKFRMELRGGYMSVKSDNEPTGLSQGTLKVIPLQLSLQYRLKMGAKLFPYLTIGAGYYINSFDLEKGGEWQALGYEINDDVDSGAGFHAGLGLDYFFSPSVAFALDARYVFANLKGTHSISEVVTGITNTGEIDVPMNHFTVGVGLRFLF